MRTAIVVCGFSLVLTAALSGQWNPIAHPTPATPAQFPIMAWDLSPSDPAQLQGMKEAGLNLSGFCRVEDLDRVRAAGLSCLVIDRRIESMNWEKMPDTEELRRIAADLKQQVGAHPAVAGFFLRDEPGATLMPGLGQLARALREAMPSKWTYINLFPTYASEQQLGTKTYEDHLATYLKDVDPQFLSWDNYSLIDGEMRDRFFTNLEVVRRFASDARIPFWNCVLANAHYLYMEPSEATLRLQVYSTLAYGGRGIQYFTYFTTQGPNDRAGAIDQFGNRTRTWDLLRRMNYQVHALAPTLVKLRSTGVWHYPDPPEGAASVSQSKLVSSVDATLSWISPPARGRLLGGEFEDDSGRPYLMLVNKDLNRPLMVKVVPAKSGANLIRISQYTGREEGRMNEGVWLAPGGGALFRIE